MKPMNNSIMSMSTITDAPGRPGVIVPKGAGVDEFDVSDVFDDVFDVTVVVAVGSFGIASFVHHSSPLHRSQVQ